MVLLSGLLFVLFYDGYLAETTKKTSRIFYIIVSVLSLYTQYYLGFQLVAAAIALIFVCRWRALYHYLGDMLIAGVFFVPMLLIIRPQVSAVSSQTENVMSAFGLVKGLYQSLVPLFVSATWIEPEFLKLWLVRILVVVTAVLFAKKLLSERKKEDIALAVIPVVLAAFFLIALFLLGDQGIQPRHLSSMILPFLLLSFSAFTVLRNKRIILGWAAVLILLNIGFLYEAYKPLAKPGDFRRVAEYIAANERPNQPVLVFHADAVLPLAHYYSGQNKLIALPQENSLDDWNPQNNVLQNEEQILSLINRQPDNPERFWLVNDGWCAQGTLSFNCEILEDVVTGYFEVESTMEFLKPTTVRLLHRKKSS
jgi:hypothetical protein